MTTPCTLDVRAATPGELGHDRAAMALLDLGRLAALTLRRAGAHRGSWGWNGDALLLVVDPETGERLLAARDDAQVQAVLASGRVLRSAAIPA
jgi:hypothetical protein